MQVSLPATKSHAQHMLRPERRRSTRGRRGARYKLAELQTDKVAGRILDTQDALRWLATLRWHAVVGQLVAITLATFALDTAYPTGWLLACVAVTVCSNCALKWRLRLHPAPSLVWLRVLTALDLSNLTMLLALTGGPGNPFATLYLIHVAVAAFVLDTRWTVVSIIFTSVGYGVLFKFASLPTGTTELDGGGVHALATWLALTMGAVVIAVVVRQLVRAVRERHDAILELARTASRAETIASLGTLAAGAAHELSTPLGTIAVASDELCALVRLDPEQAAEDACLIRDEVERCRVIIDRMAARAGQQRAELPVQTTLVSTWEQVLEGVASADRWRVRVVRLDAATVNVPVMGLAQAVGCLVANALAAANDVRAMIEVSVSLDGDCIVFDIWDDGPGIPAQIKNSLGDPFVTTQAPGEGMGLGIFLCRAFVDAWSGDLRFDDRPQGGTHAVLDFPAECGVT